MSNWGEPCSVSRLADKASDQWRCVWCGTPQRRCVPVLTLAKTEAPKLMRFHTAISEHCLSSYRYCSDNCSFQSAPPLVKREAQQDFHLFCVVRNAISELRTSMLTSTTFALLRSKYDAGGEKAKSEWVMALQFMYNNTKTPIYAIKAERDPSVRLYHGLCQVAITLRHPRFFWTAVLLFAKCTNRKMMSFIKSHLEVMLDDAKMREWIPADCRRELALLEKEGGLKSCTKLGNGKNADRIGDILAFLNFVSNSSTCTLGALMDRVLDGSVECSAEIRILAAESKLRYIGAFKSYFAAKMLGELAHSVRVKTIVGPNLETGRDQGAFNRLFGSALSNDLRDDEHIYLLHLVAEQGRSSGAGAVLNVMKDDDYEHALCEWVKASRGRDAFVGGPSVKKRARAQI